MGIREKLNKNPAIAAALAIGVVVLAVGCVLFEIHRLRHPWGEAATTGFFSDDDGATYFVDSLNRTPPFDHDGKRAVTAFVFKCRSGAAFVGYLQRYTAKGLKELQSPGPGTFLEPSEIQISAPLKGEKGWTATFGNAAPAILNVKCPDGSTEAPQPVQP